MRKTPLFYPNIRSYILRCIVYKILGYSLGKVSEY